MKKVMVALALTAATLSGSVLAGSNTGLSLDVVPQKGGAWVTVENNGAPQAGMEITVKGAQDQQYVTSESGRVFVYSAFEAARSMTFEVSDEAGKTVSTQRFIPSNRS